MDRTSRFIRALEISKEIKSNLSVLVQTSPGIGTMATIKQYHPDAAVIEYRYNDDYAAMQALREHKDSVIILDMSSMTSSVMNGATDPVMNLMDYLTDDLINTSNRLIVMTHVRLDPGPLSSRFMINVEV